MSSPATVTTRAARSLEATLRWRERYLASLASPYGWWSVVALDWLEPGENVLGSAPAAQLHLPARFPERAAVLTLAEDGVTVAPAWSGLLVDGRSLEAPLTVDTDLVLHAQDAAAPVKLSLIRRGDLWGVRVYDPVAAAGHDPAAEVAWFEPDDGWRLAGDLLPPEQDEVVPVQNMIGQIELVPVRGRVRFRYGQQEHTLLATEATGGRLFLNFRDATNGEATYPGGRFLTTEPPVDGRVTLDFNVAHHPPCAHTAYATCPMPTPGNALPFEVTAGERLAAIVAG